MKGITVKIRHFLLIIVLSCVWSSVVQATEVGEFVELSAETLRDKIRGGLLGQMLGNLNGLKHEMKYINEPGKVEQYTPALPEGAWTGRRGSFWSM